MSSTHDDDFQEIMPTEETTELEAGPRAERPNFLTATRFVDFDLPPEILEGLDKAGFEYCTPIQAQAIPVAMSGRDIAGQAQTGTGKTTAFLVPMLTRLLANKPMEPGVPRALIVTPTRELALQIYEDAQVLAEATGLRLALVIGGIEYKEQAELLSSGPEIVICTPGRIIDYLQQGIFKTKGVEVAVVDEADRLLDMGFIKDLKLLLGKLPSFDRRQTMLFSATLDDRVMELTYQYMNPPQYITAEPDKATRINIEQELYHVGRDEKLSLLMGLLKREEHRRVIIFCNTKSGVEWLSKKLTLNGFHAEGITGDLPQPKRLKLMEAFKENRLQILVATDVASRGIHVDDVSHVYNYDLPQDAENYVHRIGRTARAGHAGKAVSFGCEDYVFHLEAIENLLGYKIPVFWAEQEWFQNDEGGEVRVERRGGDRDRKKGPGRGGRESSGGGREAGGGGGGRVSRGPAKSHRLGGIFGLSPRSTGDGPDERQQLSWTVAGLANAVDEEPIVDLDIVENPEAVVPAVAVEAEAPVAEREGKSDRERERRRKRRRGRRGGSQAEAQANAAAPVVSASEAAPAAEPARPAEPSRYPTARVADKVAETPAVETPSADAEKKAARKPRRSPAKKAPETVAPSAAPATEEVAAPAEKTKAAPKPRAPRAVKKAAADTAAPAAEAPQAAPAKKAAAPKKPAARAVKKDAAVVAQPEAAPQAEPVKKAAAPRKPRVTAAAKKPEAAAEAAKPAPQKAAPKAVKKETTAPAEAAPKASATDKTSAKAPASAKDKTAPKKPRVAKKPEGKAEAKAPAKAKDKTPAKAKKVAPKKTGDV